MQRIECIVGIAFTGLMVLALILRERVEGNESAALKEADEGRWDLPTLFKKILKKKNLREKESTTEH